jgi:uncharacterized protein involved in cysteine biosynthesis
MFKLKRVHKIVGIITVVLFLLSGQYMEYYYPNIEEADKGLRLLLRSRHIYILLSGLINISLGLYLISHAQGWRKWLQLVGSILIIIAPILLIAAFLYEPQVNELKTPFSPWAIYILFAGVLFHLVSGKLNCKNTSEGISKRA